MKINEFLERIRFRPNMNRLRYDFLLFMISAIGAQTAPKLNLYNAFKFSIFAFTLFLIWDLIRGIRWKKKDYQS